MPTSKRPSVDAIGWCVSCGTWSRRDAAVHSPDHWATDPALAHPLAELDDHEDAWLCPGCTDVAWGHGIRCVTPDDPMWCPCAGQHADTEIVTWDGCPDGRMGER